MDPVYQSIFLKALGWSLAANLWQMGILWLLYTGITANGRKFSATQRHNLALLSLLGGGAWFIVDLFINLFHLSSEGVDIIPGPLSDLPLLASLLNTITPYLSITYLSILSFLFIKLLYSYKLNLRLLHMEAQADPILADFLDKMASQMGISKKVGLWMSKIIDTPMTIGFWKPVILFPVAVLNQLSISQAEAIIIHELHHIKRCDYLINLIISFAEVFLFFNPFARFLTAVIKKERENSCDDKVIQLQFDARQYGEALLILEKSRLSANMISIAATGNGAQTLLDRIKRLAGSRPSPAPVLGKLTGLLFCLLFGLSAGWNKQNEALAPAKSITTVIPSNNAILTRHAIEYSEEKTASDESSIPGINISAAGANNNIVSLHSRQDEPNKTPVTGNKRSDIKTTAQASAEIKDWSMGRNHDHDAVNPQATFISNVENGAMLPDEKNNEQSELYTAFPIDLFSGNPELIQLVAYSNGSDYYYYASESIIPVERNIRIVRLEDGIVAIISQETNAYIVRISANQYTVRNNNASSAPKTQRL